jgi:hypothetical protein
VEVKVKASVEVASVAGKICIGTENVPNDPILSKAYAEGRKAAVTAEGLGANPHTEGTPEYRAWAGGYVTHFANPDNLEAGRDCCADPYGAGFGDGTVAIVANPTSVSIPNAGTAEYVLTVTFDGTPIPGIQVVTGTNNPNIATAGTPDLTDASGQTTVTATGTTPTGGGCQLSNTFGGVTIYVTGTVAAP